MPHRPCIRARAGLHRRPSPFAATILTYSANAKEPSHLRKYEANMLKIIGDFVEHSLDAWAARRQHQRAIDELYALDDRALADIGISRAEIPFVLSRSSTNGRFIPANA